MSIEKELKLAQQKIESFKKYLQDNGLTQCYVAYCAQVRKLEAKKIMKKKSEVVKEEMVVISEYGQGLAEPVQNQEHEFDDGSDSGIDKSKYANDEEQGE